MSGIVEINWKPSDRMLRHFGFIAVVAFGGLAAAAWTERLMFSSGLGVHRQQVASVLAAVAVFCLVASLTRPRANRPLYLGLTLLSYPIGFVLSYVIMAVLFYGVFAPIAMFMRLLRRDPLHRRADPAARGYWIRVKPRGDASSYFRQF
jgi:hypothetical protein